MNDFERAVQSLSAALEQPQVMTSPAPWAGHTPFAMWLVTVLQPRIFVELGSYSGISYLSFCQAIAGAQLPTHCFAVDTWGGDEHAGFYGEHIYQTLRGNHDSFYGSFSTLLRKTFDEAVSDFADGSVDLLHIDGLHTYEAVKHDFETWLPKLSERAVVLFHDTEVRRDDFGVWKFWDEVRIQYPHLSFRHSNGLGVLWVGSKSQQPLVAQGLAVDATHTERSLQKVFAALGAAQERRAELHGVRHELIETQTLLRTVQEGLSHEQQQLVSAHNGLMAAEEERLRLNARVDSLAQEARNHQQALKECESAHAFEKETVEQLQEALQRLQNTLTESDAISKERHDWIVSQDQILLAKERALALNVQHMAKMQMQIERSLPNRIQRGARAMGRNLRPSALVRTTTKIAHRARNAARYLLRGDFAALKRRAQGLMQERQFAQMVAAGAGQGQVGIMTTPHTLYVAHAVEHALNKLGFDCEILLEDAPGPFTHDFYIVLCAQMFKHLPPGEKRIVFQMEQTVSDRWFDERYLNVLENSRAVLDYSLANLSYLADKKIAYPHVFHVPLGPVSGYAQWRGLNAQVAEKDRPSVLFYGDANAPRRKAYLEQLQKHYNVRIINNLFGAELQTVISQAQVVVNIHYYEGALLESTRIFECLSLGAKVVSESAADVDDYPGLGSVVSFVPVGDIDAMVQAVGQVLQGQQLGASNDKRKALYMEQAQQRFEFMLYRALLAQRLISFNQLTQVTEGPAGNAFVLSLPETMARRDAYLAAPAPGVQIFDGIRARPGWIGCALSYKYLCSKAHAQGLKQLLICEDDVELPANYNSIYESVQSYLAEQKGQWSIFVGIIASLHKDTQILDVQERDGLTFVTIDRMTSMVFNIYSPQAMDLIGRWDETNEDDQTNTIDRYLERTDNLRVITLLEPIFGHREELTSSLWGFTNDAYNSHIEKSRELLAQKVAEYRAKSSALADQ